MSGGWLVGIAKKLETLGHGTYTPSATTGDLFIGKMPQTPDTAIAVYYGSTGESDSGLDYDEVAFQVRTRAGTDPRTAAATLQDIYDDLHGIGTTTITDGTTTWTVIDILATQSAPVPLGQDDANRWEYTLNFRAEIINPNR